MFGYVKPCKAQLRICEYETYKAVYCGLCKQLGRQYGPFSRLTLSFDFTFLALLQMALDENPPVFSPGRCLLNPLKKQPCCQDNASLSFSADVAMIMFYFKVLDNYQDGGLKERALSLVCMPFVKHAYLRASERLPDVAEVVYEIISKQSTIESSHCSSVDQACEPTALALSQICAMLGKDNGQIRVLSRFGYLLGRYIYMADALDDLEQDLRQHSYNPFLLRENLTATVSPEAIHAVRENAKGSLYLTMGELAKTYSLLELKAFTPILDNIIHLGLHEAVEGILIPKEKSSDDRPL